MFTWIVISVAGGVFIGFVLSYVLQQLGIQRSSRESQAEAEKLLREAEEKKAELLKEVDKQRSNVLATGREEVQNWRRREERTLKRRRVELEKWDRKMQNRESTLDRRFEALEQRDKQLVNQERQLEHKKREITTRAEEIKTREVELRRRYEEIAGLSEEQAKKLLLENLERELRQEAASLIRKVELETREFANRKARQIIALAIQKCASEQVTETTVTMVPLPGDEMKGRIIGREGRNIRAFEAATGCNLIVDDTPEAVVLSCFDPLRREVGMRALERLISDGRIHPARIEEVVEKVQKEMDEVLKEAGEQAAMTLGIFELHPEVIRLLGKLKFRTSYGQNVLNHSVEVAQLAAVMAAELGLDVYVAKRSGLLHDLGKAVSADSTGTHALVGAELAKKYGEAPAVVHALAAHHGEEEFRTVVAVLVQAADAISASRPGARREALESYIKRLEKLEEIASSFDGVAKCYALQAGRELRIMVEPDKLKDTECAQLAHEVSKRIESDLQYPGQVKVVVLREIRAIDYAT